MELMNLITTRSLLIILKKAGIMIGILLFPLIGLSQKQSHEIKVIDYTIKYALSNKTDSIITLLKKPLSVNWDEVLSISFLQKNKLGKNDPNDRLTPFDPIPIEKYLNEEDIQFMLAESKNSTLKKWKKQQFKNTGIKLGTKKAKAYFEVSAPVLSKNSKIAIIRVDYFCGGECAEGTLYILEKKDNNWYHLCEITLWIS